MSQFLDIYPKILPPKAYKACNLTTKNFLLPMNSEKIRILRKDKAIAKKSKKDSH